MALSATTIATAIAALSVTGVTVKDLTAIPEEVFGRDCPLVFPDPSEFMSDLKVTRESFGAASGAFKVVRYNLNYIYMHNEVGEERGLFKVYQDAVSKLTAFIDAVIADDVIGGAIDNLPGTLAMGVVTDPTGKQFIGAKLAIGIQEFVNP